MTMSVAVVVIFTFCVQTVVSCPVDVASVNGSVLEYAPIGTDVILYNGMDTVYFNDTVDTITLYGDLSKHFLFNSTIGTLQVTNELIDRTLDPINGLINCNTTGNVTTVINVKNVNNINSISFLDAPSDVIKVNETDKTGTGILIITAEDSDTNNIQYKLYGDQSFEIDALTGNVTIKEPLDSRQNATHYMTIYATSYGYNSSGQTFNQTANTSLTVEVLNTDVYPPEFKFSNCNNDTNMDCGVYKAKINVGETQKVLELIPNNITAFDVDSNHADITYSFSWGDPENYENYFTINSSTGLVSMNNSIPTPGVYFIEVKALESTGKSSTASFYVTAEAVVDTQQSYPDYVVYGIIGGWMGCLAIFIAVTWFLIWKLRQTPGKNVQKTIQEQPRVTPNQYANSQLGNAMAMPPNHPMHGENTQNPIRKTTIAPPQQGNQRREATEMQPSIRGNPNYSNQRSVNEPVYQDNVNDEAVYEMEPNMGDGLYAQEVNGHVQDTYEQPVTGGQSGKYYENAPPK